MEQLLAHHIRETERRFDEVMSKIDAISQKIETLNEFKMETIISARWVSLIISASCGLLTLVASSAVSYMVGKH